MPKPDRFQFLGRCDEISIVGDEAGFELHFSTPRGDYVVNVHGVARDLYVTVHDEIGPWLDEAADAWRNRHVTDDNSLHSVHADIWDGRQR